MSHRKWSNKIHHEYVVAKTGWCGRGGLILFLHTFKIFQTRGFQSEAAGLIRVLHPAPSGTEHLILLVSILLFPALSPHP